MNGVVAYSPNLDFHSLLCIPELHLKVLSRMPRGRGKPEEKLTNKANGAGEVRRQPVVEQEPHWGCLGDSGDGERRGRESSAELRGEGVKFMLGKGKVLKKMVTEFQ